MFKRKKDKGSKSSSGGDSAVHSTVVPFIKTGVPRSGDVEEKQFRKPHKSTRLKEDRAHFNDRLAMLRGGYVSESTLLGYQVDRTLGTGSFGRVLLTQKKDLPELFLAVKIINKERVIKTRQVEHTCNEKNILFCMKSPFIVALFDYFQDARCLYFVLEFVNGGEMFTHIQKQKKRRFNYEQTRFFAAETILAFEYLHNLDIIFRDLKPENMLIDHRGHIRLTDFGFAKRVEDKTWTMCGTPEYLAPEIIVNKGYNHAVDWWAVGVLIYEMRCGRSPFEARSQLEMFKRISRQDFSYPKGFTAEEQGLIGGLLQVDLTKRLGAMHGGVDAIKKLPYFKGLDWDAVAETKVPSPYIPKVKGPGDTDQFDRYPEEDIRWYGTGPDAFGDTFKSF